VGDTGSDCAVGSDILEIAKFGFVRDSGAAHRQAQPYRFAPGDHNESESRFRRRPCCWMLCSGVRGCSERRVRSGRLEGHKINGEFEVAPALYFGTAKINNDFDVVDAVGKEDGKGMTATLFRERR
jgi:hypothetical protein